MSSSETISNNVQALIDHLHQDGVIAGQEQGKKIIQDAETRAQWIIEQAEKQADEIIQQANDKAHFLEKSAQSALTIAARDMLLSIKEQLENHLSDQLQHLIEGELADPAFMLKLLEEAIQQQWLNGHQVEILVPERILDLSEIGQEDKQTKPDPLLPAIRSLTQSALEKGIHIKGHQQSGLVIRLDQGNIEIQTDEASLTEWLVQFVHPRFRALIDGVIR